MLALRVERQKRGMSQVKLCGLTGISPSDISAIENGIKKPFPGWKARIAEALGMPADELFKPVEQIAAPGLVAATGM